MVQNIVNKDEKDHKIAKKTKFLNSDENLTTCIFSQYRTKINDGHKIFPFCSLTQKRLHVRSKQD